MTLNNVTMRQGTVAMQPQQQRWSIPADGRHLMVQKEPHQYGQRSRHSAALEDHCRRSWSSDSTDSVISSESGNPYYRVVLIGEQGVGKSTLANIFAGVHDSMDSDCEVLGGRWPRPRWASVHQRWSSLKERVGGPFIRRVGSGDYAFLALARGSCVPEQSWHRSLGQEDEEPSCSKWNLGQKGVFLDSSSTGPRGRAVKEGRIRGSGSHLWCLPTLTWIFQELSVDTAFSHSCT